MPFPSRQHMFQLCKRLYLYRYANINYTRFRSKKNKNRPSNSFLRCDHRNFFRYGSICIHEKQMNSMLWTSFCFLCLLYITRCFEIPIQISDLLKHKLNGMCVRIYKNMYHCFIFLYTCFFFLNSFLFMGQYLTSCMHELSNDRTWLVVIIQESRNKFQNCLMKFFIRLY